MVEEAYVSYKAAKLLNEKGFDIVTQVRYAIGQVTEKWYNDYRERMVSFNYDEGSIIIPSMESHEKYELYGDTINCPTQQLVCRWLREVHHLHVVAFCPLVDMDAKEYGVTYNLVISDLNNNCLAVDTGLEDIEYNSYELAIQKGIEYCLEHLI